MFSFFETRPSTPALVTGNQTRPSYLKKRAPAPASGQRSSAPPSLNCQSRLILLLALSAQHRLGYREHAMPFRAPARSPCWWALCSSGGALPGGVEPPLKRRAGATAAAATRRRCGCRAAGRPPAPRNFRRLEVSRRAARRHLSRRQSPRASGAVAAKDAGRIQGERTTSRRGHAFRLVTCG